MSGPEGQEQPGSSPTEVLALVCLQKSALIVQGPREVKKRELVFLQFRLNESSADFSAIDYLLFSSFREFLHRWPPGRRATPCSRLAHRAGRALRTARVQSPLSSPERKGPSPVGGLGTGSCLEGATAPSPFGNRAAELGGGGWEASW